MMEDPKTQEAPAEQPAADPAAELSARLEAAEGKAKEAEQKYLYLYAEFENYKKRIIKERSDLVKFGWEGVARELLDVADNLDRALHHAPAGIDANWLQGIQMVAQQFHNALEKQGVSPVHTKEFDPNLHEAVGQEDSEQPAGTILKEHSRGYLLHGRLLRPARVVVSAGRNA
jgi:molecular chaperone GrpE